MASDWGSSDHVERQLHWGFRTHVGLGVTRPTSKDIYNLEFIKPLRTGGHQTNAERQLQTGGHQTHLGLGVIRPLVERQLLGVIRPTSRNNYWGHQATVERQQWNGTSGRIPPTPPKGNYKTTGGHQTCRRKTKSSKDKQHQQGAIRPAV